MAHSYSPGGGNLCSHEGTLTHLANTIELVHPSAQWSPEPNSKSIGSAVFAQLTVESIYTLQWAPLSYKIALPTGDRDPRLTRDSSDPFEFVTETAPRPVQPFLHR